MDSSVKNSFSYCYTHLIGCKVSIFAFYDKKNVKPFACFKKTIYLCIAFEQETSCEALERW